MTERSTDQGGTAAPRSLDLTPRQRQILGLMCKGKANKEIANELDISLGTVKQHIAALFKRMRVQNRSMAVAQGKDLLAQRPPVEDVAAAVTGADWADDIMLIRRPCVVLAVRVSAILAAGGQTRIRALVKSLAAESKAFHLPGADDIHVVLFGVRRPSIWDPINALLLLRQLRDRLLEQGWCATDVMAAALDAGVAVISIDARGRWSGDTVATPVISITRRLLGKCQGGTLGLGVNALHLLERLHGLNRTAVGARLALADLEAAFSLELQKAAEAILLPRLEPALDTPSGKILQLLGPIGSGKSHLCRALVARARARGRAVCYLRFMPRTPALGAWDADTGAPVMVADRVQTLLASLSAGPRLLVVDDIDLLESEQERTECFVRLRPALTSGCLIILTARNSLFVDAESVILKGMDVAALERLLSGSDSAVGAREGGPAAPGMPQHIQSLFSFAEGNPLFTLELGPHPHGNISLPVLLVIASELDRHPLDWRLLRVLVQASQEPTLTGIQDRTAMPIAEIEQGVRAAIDAGVLADTGANQTLAQALTQTPIQTLSFARPLLRRAVAAILI